jgi:hypothetical protein
MAAEVRVSRLPRMLEDADPSVAIDKEEEGEIGRGEKRVL